MTVSNEELSIIGIEIQSHEVRSACLVTDIEGIREMVGQGLAIMTATAQQARELLFKELPADFAGVLALSSRPEGEAVAQYRHPQWPDKTRWHDIDASSSIPALKKHGMEIRVLHSAPASAKNEPMCGGLVIYRCNNHPCGSVQKTENAELAKQWAADGYEVSRFVEDGSAPPAAAEGVPDATLDHDGEGFFVNPLESSVTCFACNKKFTLEQRGEADGNCPHCGYESDLEALICLQQNLLNSANAELARLRTQSPAHSEHSLAMVGAQAGAVPEEFRGIMSAVFAELEHRHNRDDGNAPGHAHEIPGVWDDDNGELAGKPCAWCALWKKAKAILDSAAGDEKAIEFGRIPRGAHDMLRQAAKQFRLHGDSGHAAMCDAHADALSAAPAAPVAADERDWIPAHSRKPAQGERVLLAIKYEECPVVGYWGASEWEVCTVNLDCDTGNFGNGGTVERGFDSEDVTFWMPLKECPDDDTTTAALTADGNGGDRS